MRKLLLLPAFVIAGSLALGALTQPASATFKECVPGATETALRSSKSICEGSCKKEKDEKGCVALCDGDYKHCSDKLKQKKADDDRAKEARQKDLDHQKYVCRKPYTDCLLKCPQGHNDQNKKCEDACNKGKVFYDYEACIKKVVP
jgi:hypothetical protein